MAIRNAAKAIVIWNGKILLNRCITEDGEIYYDLPGGQMSNFLIIGELCLTLPDTLYAYVK